MSPGILQQTLESILCNDYPAEHYDILVINDLKQIRQLKSYQSSKSQIAPNCPLEFMEKGSNYIWNSEYKCQ